MTIESLTQGLALRARKAMQPGSARAPEARTAALLTGLVVLGVGLAIVDALPVGVFYDDAMYVILAKSLATGHGYRWLNLPGTPPATHFPPGYPALLAAIWRAFPHFPANVLAFKAANAVLLAFASGAMVFVARRRFGFSPLAAAALSVAGCAVIPVLALSSVVLSEPLFLALLLPILIFAERVVEGERRPRDLILLGLFAGTATLVRSHGIALAFGLALAVAVRRPTVASEGDDWRASLPGRLKDATLLLFSAALPILPWQLWVRANQTHLAEPLRGLYESYTAWMANGLRSEGVGLLWHTLVRTSLTTAGMFATFGTPLAFGWARLLVLITLAVLLIFGARRAWLAAPATALFLALYSAIVALWPYAPARFVWGVWPLVVLVFVLGARDLASWAPRRPVPTAARAALLACSLFVAAGYIRYNARGYRDRWWSNVARTQAPKFRPTVLWVRSHTGPGDVIASTNEPTVYLYTGRQAVPATSFTVRDYFRAPTLSEAETAVRQVLAAYHVDAVVADGDPLRAAAQSMASRAAPELRVRDSLATGLVFAPVVPPFVSQQPAP